ncbi:MAG: hypothetical protein JSW66_02470 [Phycisphaerales bacterium]|nr:MAG: hypothetical protein JSW66_02470 [Phycisphaerales bacterium]
MASSHGDTEGSRSLSTKTGGRTDTSADEIDLNDYLRVVWKRRHLVVLGTFLPALLFCLILAFSPGECRVTYTYDVRSDEKDPVALLGGFTGAGASDKCRADLESDELPGTVHTMVPDRFYSDENLDRLAARLRECGFGDYAERISRANVQLETSETSLAMTVTGRRGEDVQRISSIVRDNLENVIPMYFVEEHLSGEVVRLKSEMANIEEDRFSLELELGRKKAILVRLKTLASADPGMTQSGPILHFENVHKDSAYLPLSYHVQAADVNIINIEETINADQKKYSYYGKLLSLDERLLEEVRNKMSSHYAVGEFHSFLARVAGDYEGSELRHYLSAYVKRVENVMSASAPIVERPGVYLVPKGSLKKTGIVFAALLMITTFGAFLLEAVQESRKRVREA